MADPADPKEESVLGKMGKGFFGGLSSAMEGVDDLINPINPITKLVTSVVGLGLGLALGGLSALGKGVGGLFDAMFKDSSEGQSSRSKAEQPAPERGTPSASSPSALRDIEDAPRTASTSQFNRERSEAPGLLASAAPSPAQLAAANQATLDADATSRAHIRPSMSI